MSTQSIQKNINYFSTLDDTEDVVEIVESPVMFELPKSGLEVAEVVEEVEEVVAPVLANLSSPWKKINLLVPVTRKDTFFPTLGSHEYQERSIKPKPFTRGSTGGSFNRGKNSISFKIYTIGCLIYPPYIILLRNSRGISSHPAIK